MPRIVADLLPAADEVEALVEFVEESRDLAGVVLQVRVHGDQYGSAGRAYPSIKRRRLAEVCTEMDDRDVVVFGIEAVQDLGATILAAVVDEDDFVTSCDLFEGDPKLPVKLLQAILLVKKRDQDADFDFVAHG